MSEKRTHISSGAPWENLVGYSRLVRVGNIIEVSGTTAVQDDKVVGKGNVYEQTKFIFSKIDNSLKQVGSSLEDVVRTRMYVTDISEWSKVGKAHHEFFASVKPATSMIQVSALIDPDLLIEIEVTAIAK